MHLNFSFPGVTTPLHVPLPFTLVLFCPLAYLKLSCMGQISAQVCNVLPSSSLLLQSQTPLVLCEHCSSLSLLQ